MAIIEKDSIFNVEAHSEARKSINEVLSREEIFWRQKSRVAWLKDGDRATKFFMASTVTRRRKNYIQSLKDDRGNWVDQANDIANLFSSKFASTFTKMDGRIRMTEEDMLMLSRGPQLDEFLCSIPEEDEICSAISSMGSDKAPGPDGIPVAFYKSH